MGMEGIGGGEKKGEEGGEDALWVSTAAGWITQEDLPRVTTLVDACNGFNKMSCLAMVWTVRHHWPLGVRFAFNHYKHCAQLLLRRPVEDPITILNRERVT